MTGDGNKWKDIQRSETGALARLVCRATAIPIKSPADFFAETETHTMWQGQDSDPGGTHTLKLWKREVPTKIREKWPQLQRFARTSSVPWRERENSSTGCYKTLSPGVRLALLWVNEAFCFRKEVKLLYFKPSLFRPITFLTFGILRSLSIQRKWSWL